MSLRLILGRAGAGKTQACIQQIQQGLAAGTAKDEFILLTPEQATFTNEKRLLNALGAGGGFQVKVLSFRRFVHWVVQETGGGLDPVLDSVAKSMVIRNILDQRLEELAAFRRVWDKSGFVSQVAGIIDELRVYKVNPETLYACLEDTEGANEASDALLSKLKDIHLLYTDYEAFLSGGWLDLAGELSLLCQKLPLWERLGSARFWLDGFHGFTEAEFDVIRRLLAADKQICVALNLPGKEEERSAYEQDALFYPTWETARRLLEIAEADGCGILPPLYLEEPEKGRFAGNKELARLEKALAGRLPEEAAPAPDTMGDVQAGCIRLASCAQPRQEVERLALEILEAARDEQLRYRDMAVLLRTPESYRSLIDSILPSHGIPYFFDTPKTLKYHPLVSFLRTLAAFMKGDWNTETLITYMKTGFAGLTDHQVSALENYCLAYGIRRMHWESPRPWRFSPPDEEEHTFVDGYMERLRQTLWLPLAAFREELTKADCAQSAAAAAYRHLLRVKAQETCSRMAKEAADHGEPEIAQIHQRVWQALMKLLDQTVHFFNASGREGAELPQLIASVWESGLDAMEMAALPPALDQVSICSMDRSRSPLASKVWVLGANEGVIPANMKEDGLLDTAERQWLAGREIRLAPDNRRRLFSESYLIYIALTRASGSLHISCARADSQGRSQAPSALLEQLCRWFPGLSIDEAEPGVIRQLNHPAASLQQLGMALQRGRAFAQEGTRGNAYSAEDDTGLWRYVYQWFARRTQEYGRDLERLHNAYHLTPLGQPLPAELAQQLFGKVIQTSVTRLELYQACPFAHFLAYGLRLEPRAEYEVQPPEIGNYFHDSLEALIRGVQAEGLSLGDLDADMLEAQAEKAASAQLTQKNYDIFQTSAWYRRLSENLRRILRSSVEMLAYQESQSGFHSQAFELAFGYDEPGYAPPVSLPLGGDRRVLLRGRVDRIDEALLRQGGERYLRILDYKSGVNDLHLYEIYHGLKLQLILYMEASLAASPGAKPAGLFYFHVHDPILTAADRLEAGDEDWRMQQMIKAYALRGYLLKNHDVAYCMDKGYKKSLFLPVSVVQSGDFGKNAKVLTEENFQLLGERSRQVLRRAGQGIMRGDIRLSPYQIGVKTACAYCQYRSVCRFDPAIPGHAWRRLPALADELVLARLKNAADGERLMEEADTGGMENENPPEQPGGENGGIAR